MDYYYFHNPNVDAASGSLSLSWSSSSSMASTSKNRKNKKNGGAKKSTKGAVMKLSTDPQSIAARERRHRISDRFKILQSLVPGGSKMDTVSMLEEAIQYVKFLKNQIWLHQSMMMIADLTSENSCDVDVMEPTPSSDLLLPCSCGTYNNYDCDQVGLGFDNDDLFAQLQAELPPLTLPEPCFQGQESHVLWFSGGAHEDMK